MNIVDKSIRMRELREEINLLDEQIKAKREEYDYLRNHEVPNELEDMGLSSIKIVSIGYTCYTVPEIYPPQILDQPAAHDWLRAEGYGDIIKPTIHWSSLKALVKEQMKEGVVFPSELFKIEPFTQARLKKS